MTRLITSLFVVLTLFLTSCSKEKKAEYTALQLEQINHPHDGGFVGSSQCASCHETQFQDWTGSDHQLAMQLPTEESVLGDFNDSSVTFYGITSRFFKKGDTFIINTQGPDGDYHDYEVKYTFGYFPLQQYLVDTGKGKLQVVTPFWDSNTKEDGGQKWEHIYPKEFIDSHDELHWGRELQNWNYMCAECHSTNVKKNFDPETSSYNTTWDEINVSCEACHGPGDLHLKWAESSGGEQLKNKGLLFDIIDRDSGYFIPNPEDGSITRSEPKTNQMQVEYCARCHARRTQLTDDYTYGKVLENTHQVALIDPPLYHEDGTTNDEDYVYGSFLQSKMYHQGVSCKDCHNVHSTKLKLPGKNVCAQCHIPELYDTPDHSKHNFADNNPDCISCHMPKQKIMVVDPRSDHSMRIPRPDLSEKTGSFNACNNCHKDKSVQWAVQGFKELYGNKYDTIGHYGLTLQSLRKNEPGAQLKLDALMADPEIPEIIKATAYSLIDYQNNPQGLKYLQEGLKNSNAIIRRSATQSIANLRPEQQFTYAKSMVNDSVLSVRFASYTFLYNIPLENLNPTDQELVKKVQLEYFKQLSYFQDRSAGEANIGSAYASLGQIQRAEKHFRKALELDSLNRFAMVNYADLKRQENKDQQAVILLKEALKIDPNLTLASQALGFTYIRLKRTDLAMQEFKQAYEKNPTDPNAVYYYAIMLNDAKQTSKAITILEKSLSKDPYNSLILNLAFSMYRQTGNRDKAIEVLNTFVRLYPNNPQYEQALNQI
ncbi:MAG: tetratricopeptide repeat protein [Flavobacteriaceae bacterium]